MTDLSISVSVRLQECQIVTLLPAGGGDNGGRGGSSVGVAPGVPVPTVGVGGGNTVPLGGDVRVADLIGVRVGVAVLCTGEEVGVLVACVPGGSWVSVSIGPGYCCVSVSTGPGYCDVSVS